MRTKKASLSLSVNAIVILIIAVVMLGLALGFIKMMFGGATTKFGALIEEEQEPEIPTSSSQVTLSRTLVIAKPGEDEAIKVSLLNPTASQWEDVTPSVSCTGANTIESTGYDKDIPPQRHVTFGLLLPIAGTAIEGTSLCEVTFTTATTSAPTIPSADFTVRVRYG